MGLNLRIGHNFTDQAHDGCLRSGEGLAAQKNVHGGELAHRAREALRGPTTGHDANLDFGLAKARALTRHDDVGVHGQLAAAPQGVAAHSGNHGFTAPADSAPKAIHVARDDLRRRGIDIFVQIRAGAKGAFASRENDDLDGWVSVQPDKCGGQCLPQRQVQRIEHAGAVQPHLHHTLCGVFFKQDVVDTGVHNL